MDLKWRQNPLPDYIAMGQQAIEDVPLIEAGI
jgi:hypothetical protein